jgi:hypothetical protein
VFLTGFLFFPAACPGGPGQHFEIREEGDWWAAVPDEEWPDAASGQRDVILSDFVPGAGVGDRRQEIVFIGAGMDEVMTSASCLPQCYQPATIPLSKE